MTQLPEECHDLYAALKDNVDYLMHKFPTSFEWEEAAGFATRLLRSVELGAHLLEEWAGSCPEDLMQGIERLKSRRGLFLVDGESWQPLDGILHPKSNAPADLMEGDVAIVLDEDDEDRISRPCHLESLSGEPRGPEGHCLRAMVFERKKDAGSFLLATSFFSLDCCQSFFGFDRSDRAVLILDADEERAIPRYAFAPNRDLRALLDAFADLRDANTLQSTNRTRACRSRILEASSQTSNEVGALMIKIADDLLWEHVERNGGVRRALSVAGGLAGASVASIEKLLGSGEDGLNGSVGVVMAARDSATELESDLRPKLGNRLLVLSLEDSADASRTSFTRPMAAQIWHFLDSHLGEVRQGEANVMVASQGSPARAAAVVAALLRATGNGDLEIWAKHGPDLPTYSTMLSEAGLDIGREEAAARAAVRQEVEAAAGRHQAVRALTIDRLYERKDGSSREMVAFLGLRSKPRILPGELVVFRTVRSLGDIMAATVLSVASSADGVESLLSDNPELLDPEGWGFRDAEALEEHLDYSLRSRRRTVCAALRLRLETPLIRSDG